MSKPTAPKNGTHHHTAAVEKRERTAAKKTPPPPFGSRFWICHVCVRHGVGTELRGRVLVVQVLRYGFMAGRGCAGKLGEVRAQRTAKYVFG